MYMKVAVSAVTILLVSGCVSQSQLNASRDGNLVGEGMSDGNATIMPLDGNATIKESNSRKKASYFKPEPFSLKSNEDDPELLGPQTTLKKPLTRAEDNTTESM